MFSLGWLPPLGPPAPLTPFRAAPIQGPTLVPSLFAHGVPVYPYTLAASSSLAWPLAPVVAQVEHLRVINLELLSSFRE
jgi:hypothetical protein